MKLPAGIVLALAYAGGVHAACSSNLLVDNYANYANHQNSLGSYTSGK
jgi:hypothetical protein